MAERVRPGIAETFGTPPPGWAGPPSTGGGVRTWGWLARTRLGEAKAGELEAETVEEVEARLRSLGLSSIQVRRVYLRAPLRRLKALKWWISRTDRLIVKVQLRVLREAGLPLLKCLDILDHVHDGAVARRLRGIKHALQTGMDPTEAFRTAGGDLVDSPELVIFGQP
jgi:type II secretory pathway component PulF